MVRPRKVVHIKAGNDNSSSSASSETSEKPPYKVSKYWKILGFLCLLVAVYAGALGYLQTRVNTPFKDEKVVVDTGLAIPDRYWGTYRPGTYFGIKSREPYSPVFGLMWYDPTRGVGIRHWCEQRDNLASYGWTRHDGVSFGEQTIVDDPHIITTSFVKTPGELGGQWTARVEIKHKNATPEAFHPYSIIWYGATEETPSGAPGGRLWMEGGALMGYTKQLHNFKLDLQPVVGDILHSSFVEAHSHGLHALDEKVHELLKTTRHPTFKNLPMFTPDPEMLIRGADVNFVAIHMLVELPFTMDIIYSPEIQPTPSLRGDAYTRALQQKIWNFDMQFEEKFALKQKGYSDVDVSIARAALSNMVGGIGYFYGSGRVKSTYTSEPVPYWRAPLYTAVPSRSFFPRGFLWDEGFHGLLLSRWSPSIELDIISHWLDLANVEGWIPREQILGQEALVRVPKEFVVQTNDVANPPMLAITLARLVASRPELFQRATSYNAQLDRMFTRLQAWYQWFLSSQKGSVPGAFRWRGRIEDQFQMNPKTLASGLDDYPRASHPTEDERHVDLRCWIYAVADAMAVIATALQRDPTKFEAVRDQLGDEKQLNELHWSPHSKTYADYGLHSEGVRLVLREPKNPHDETLMVRSVSSPPQLKLVTSAFGYVSLFPMLLKVLKPTSPNLGKILEDLDKPKLLWSPYGLRSLSKSSPFYMKHNTKNDPPYWRGQVWININYLALAALKHYGEAEGPYRERARELHGRLRHIVVGNIISEYKRTGYLWEQYSDIDGRGSGCKPFTGWTALVVLIMAEEY